jgi:hypothetical protein
MNIEFIILVLSTVTTFGLFSILIGEDNPWFAFAENAYVGVAVGLSIVLNTQYLLNNVISKATGNLLANWPLLFSLALGLMMLTRVSPKYSFIARIPIAVATGTGIAIATRAIIFSSIINQIIATIKPLLNVGDPTVLLTNFLVLFFVLTMMSYFVYTTEHKGALQTSSSIGRYILYASFGALFAITYMGRLGMLLGRAETLFIPESSMYVSIAVASIIVVSTYVLIKFYPDLMKKLTPE